MNAIETHGLTKTYGRARGIEDLTLTVREGEFFGFIGPNGAGKSTTIRTLLGLLRPTAGHARVLGQDVTQKQGALLARVGYLPGETNFWPRLRVREVLALSAGLRGRDCAGRAKELCERLQLDPGKRVEALSLGNRKKLGIVCALQHDPELLILDEPTSGLDPLMQREFFALLAERSANGTTVFLSSHILAEVQQHCTRAAVLREGRLLACDAVTALAQAGAKRVLVRGRVRPDALRTLPGVRHLTTEGEETRFLYGGDWPALLALLGGWDVADLSVTEPDLEQAFLHFYGEGGGQA